MADFVRKLLIAALVVVFGSLPASSINLPNTPADYFATGALTGTGTVAVQANGTSTVLVSATGTGTGLTFSFQCFDGVNWVSTNAYPLSSGALGAPVTSGSANGDWIINSAGCNQSSNTGVRVNLTAISGGTETFKLNASAGVAATYANLIPGGTVGLVAGSAIVGKVGIDQTTDGTTNAVHLVAGTAIAGKVGIDQTTDGTTNAVHLVAGTALAGKFGIDQTTPGTTNAVSLAQIGSGTVSTSATGVQKVGIVGNAGATMDATVGAGTAPTNMLVGGALYNSTEISPTTGQSFALQADSKGRLRNVIMDAAGNTRGANVNASNQLSVSVDGTNAVTQSTSPWIVAGGGTAGTAATGVVTVQGIASMTKLLVTPDANSAVNVAQINGVTPLMGNGTTGTGSHRVTIASDNSAVSGMGVGATAAAPPANAVYMGANASGATGGQLKGLITCDSHAKYDASDNGSITLVTGVASRKVYICSYILAVGGTATNLKLREGSDANCATNGADLTPAYQLIANDRIGMISPFWTGLVVSTNAYYVCVNASAGNAHQAEIWYTIL